MSKELLIAWVSAQQRHFYNNTRQIATPEMRIEWERIGQSLIDEIREESRAELEHRLQAVRDLHAPFERDGDEFCRLCSIEVAANVFDWLEKHPCMTLQALNGDKGRNQ